MNYKNVLQITVIGKEFQSLRTIIRFKSTRNKIFILGKLFRTRQKK